MTTPAAITLRQGLTLDAERSVQLEAELRMLLEESELSALDKPLAIWQRIQDWAGHAASGQPLRPLSACSGAIRTDEYPDESSKALLIRGVVVQALEHRLDSEARQGGFGEMLGLLGGIARLGWGFGIVTFGELGERPVPVASLGTVELDEVRSELDRAVLERIGGFLAAPAWHANGALPGSSVPVFIRLLLDVYVRAAAVQADRKAASREDLERGIAAFDRMAGGGCERLGRLSGRGLAALFLDNLMARPAIVAALCRLGAAKK
ncbi:MAG TPA: hypothetical protein PLP29_17590 [Candidatus Ozemobacteraceae bacterium]|nr:hypothetical protein [Candidatus Ozemobacteraceae bacterium]